jgi:hypothetical protein
MDADAATAGGAAAGTEACPASVDLAAYVGDDDDVGADAGAARGSSGGAPVVAAFLATCDATAPACDLDDSAAAAGGGYDGADDGCVGHEGYEDDGGDSERSPAFDEAAADQQQRRRQSMLGLGAADVSQRAYAAWVLAPWRDMRCAHAPALACRAADACLLRCTPCAAAAGGGC